MRMIGTAVAIAAAIMIATVGVADAKKRRGGGAKVYKFTIQCPVLAPVPMTVGTCSAKGTAAAARATCERQNLGCYVKSSKAAGGKKKKRG
jgi:hypothetical protein